MEKHGLPPHLFTGDPSDVNAESRIQVDVGNTGFFDGRAFRISYEFSPENSNAIGSGNSTWLRFTAPVDFILQRQEIEIDDGAIRVRIFRDGTESGTWSPVTVFRTNLVNTDYAGQVTIDDGGAITSPGVAAETIRIRTSGGTGQRTTIGGTATDERLLTAGTYYIQLENIAAGNCSGVYTLAWEERPELVSGEAGSWLADKFGAR